IENGGIGWMTHAYDFTTAFEEIRPTGINMIWLDGENSVLIQFNEFMRGEKTLHIHSIDGREIFMYSFEDVDSDQAIIVPFTLTNPGCYFAVLDTGVEKLATQFFVNIY
ncbi:MAG: hypothetical protein ABIQ11_03530, partial [Saprospiraceae bacterium]